MGLFVCFVFALVLSYIICKYFLPVHSFCSQSFNRLTEQKFLILMRQFFIVFIFMDHAFDGKFKNSLPSLGSQTLSYTFCYKFYNFTFSIEIHDLFWITRCEA